jgi:hypothetical protein
MRCRVSGMKNGMSPFWPLILYALSREIDLNKLSGVHAMKYQKLLSPILAGIALAGASQSASAGVCKDVVFNVTNNHFEERDIEIRSVKFRNPHANGSLQSEDVANTVCGYNATCSTNGDNLANADKVDLYDIQIVFRHRNHDGTWSREFITQPFTPTYRKCKDGKTYGPIVVRDSQ